MFLWYAHAWCIFRFIVFIFNLANSQRPLIQAKEWRFVSSVNNWLHVLRTLQLQLTYLLQLAHMSIVMPSSANYSHDCVIYVSGETNGEARLWCLMFLKWCFLSYFLFLFSLVHRMLVDDDDDDDDEIMVSL